MRQANQHKQHHPNTDAEISNEDFKEAIIEMVC